jgi:hypothetical protein
MTDDTTTTEAPEAPAGDSFEVSMRAGDDTRTVAFAGRALFRDVRLTWVAEVRSDGIAIHPTYDGEAPEGAEALLDGMADILGRTVAQANASAANAYRAAITESLGELTVQRALFL